MLLQLQFTLLISPAGTLKNPKHNLLMDHLKFLINLLTELRAERTWHCSSVSVTRILVGYVTIFPTETQITLLKSPDVPSSCYRVVPTELHGTADDHDSDELPAHRAVSKQLPGSAWPHAFSISLFLQDLIQLAALDLTAPQLPQSWQRKKKQLRWEVFCFCQSLAKSIMLYVSYRF